MQCTHQMQVVMGITHIPPPHTAAAHEARVSNLIISPCMLRRHLLKCLHTKDIS